jgi:hypothetical protein
MSLAPWTTAAALAAALLGAAPPASAEPTPSLPAPPEAGTESPGDTVRTLTSQGYDVKIQWTAGQPSNIPLSECTVTNIDVHAAPLAYVMVNCPADGSQ